MNAQEVKIALATIGDATIGDAAYPDRQNSAFGVHFDIRNFSGMVETDDPEAKFPEWVVRDFSGRRYGTVTTVPALEDLFEDVLLERRIVEIARQKDVLAEVCDFTDYHPDVGRVPEHWRVKYPIMAVIRELARDIPAGEI